MSQINTAVGYNALANTAVGYNTVAVGQTVRTGYSVCQFCFTEILGGDYSYCSPCFQEFGRWLRKYGWSDDQAAIADLQSLYRLWLWSESEAEVEQVKHLIEKM